jgi:hypothetical protein
VTGCCVPVSRLPPGLHFGRWLALRYAGSSVRFSPHKHGENERVARVRLSAVLIVVLLCTTELSADHHNFGGKALCRDLRANQFSRLMTVHPMSARKFAAPY